METRFSTFEQVAAQLPSHQGVGDGHGCHHIFICIWRQLVHLGLNTLRQYSNINADPLMFAMTCKHPGRSIAGLSSTQLANETVAGLERSPDPTMLSNNQSGIMHESIS